VLEQADAPARLAEFAREEPREFGHAFARVSRRFDFDGAMQTFEHPRLLPPAIVEKRKMFHVKPSAGN
jgi:hypothetical protein